MAKTTKSSKRQRREQENRDRRALRRQKEERIVRCITAGVAAAVVVAVTLLIHVASYAKAAGEYDSVRHAYVSDDGIPWVEQPLKENEPMNMEETDPDALPSENEEDVPRYPQLSVDHEGLKSANPDYVAWIYIPGCDISYPVVQGKDNDLYLDRTFEGNASSGGAIFMDYRDNADLFGFNTFLYGHNMKDGSMFGDLKKYMKNDALIDVFPFFYVYTPDGFVRKYRIFSYYTTDENADCYDRPEDEAGKTDYLLFARTHAIVQGLPYSSDYDCYMTLSTCHGSTGSGMRFLVHGVLTEMISQE